MLVKKLQQLILVCLAASTLAISGCASGPKVRSDAAANTNFSAYKTFGFIPQPATDKAGYATLVTQHFKDAISNEMTALGYQYSENDADLLINFNSNVETRTDVRSMPASSMHYSYYHYRRGFYIGLPLYTNDVDTIRYKYGTVNIDVVDAAQKQLIWEGISEGTLKKSDLDNPKQAIANVVSLIFQQYPSRQTIPQP